MREFPQDVYDRIATASLRSWSMARSHAKRSGNRIGYLEADEWCNRIRQFRAGLIKVGNKPDSFMLDTVSTEYSRGTYPPARRLVLKIT